MSCFLLPQTIGNTLKDNAEYPLNESLNEYIKSLQPEESNADLNLIIDALLVKYNIEGTILRIGEIPKTKIYDVIINNTSTLDITWLSSLKKDGALITKIEDSTSASSVQFLYKLSSAFSMVYLYKPESLYKTSIKYGIALKFSNISSYENLKIPYYFRMKLDDINSIMGQTQLEHILFKHNI